MSAAFGANSRPPVRRTPGPRSGAPDTGSSVREIEGRVVGRLLSSTRIRLVLFQVLILGLASLVASYAIFKLVTVPAQQESDAVLYDQWNKIAGSLQLQADGAVAYAPGPLPETAGDTQVPIEAALLTKDGVVARGKTQILPDSYIVGAA